jgi:hypothetical protein
MRPRMNVGDYLFGISPSGLRPRRVIFTARIAEKLTFAEAYRRFPKVRGPVGPIHVRPTRSIGLRFPYSHYEHIPGANHANDWPNDLRTPKLDAFFVCERAERFLGRWLGECGPPLTPRILEFCALARSMGRVGLWEPTPRPGGTPRRFGMGGCTPDCILKPAARNTPRNHASRGAQGTGRMGRRINFDEYRVRSWRTNARVPGWCL